MERGARKIVAWLRKTNPQTDLHSKLNKSLFFPMYIYKNADEEEEEVKREKKKIILP